MRNSRNPSAPADLSPTDIQALAERIARDPSDPGAELLFVELDPYIRAAARQVARRMSHRVGAETQIGLDLEAEAPSHVRDQMILRGMYDPARGLFRAWLATLLFHRLVSRFREVMRLRQVALTQEQCDRLAGARGSLPAAILLEEADVALMQRWPPLQRLLVAIECGLWDVEPIVACWDPWNDEYFARRGVARPPCFPSPAYLQAIKEERREILARELGQPRDNLNTHISRGLKRLLGLPSLEDVGLLVQSRIGTPKQSGRRARTHPAPA